MKRSDHAFAGSVTNPIEFCFRQRRDLQNRIPQTMKLRFGNEEAVATMFDHFRNTTGVTGENNRTASHCL